MNWFKSIAINTNVIIKLVAFVLLVSSIQCTNEYTREWIVKIRDPAQVDAIASRGGFINHGPVQPFKDVYMFTKSDIPHRSKRAAHEHTQVLNDHQHVCLTSRFDTEATMDWF